MDTQPRTCRLVRAEQSYVGRQALTYFAGVSTENTGAQAICMHLLTIPPGGRAHAHFHEAHVNVIYVLSGQAGMWWGEQLEEHMECGPSDFIYIPADVRHLPYNVSANEPCTAVIARTDPMGRKALSCVRIWRKRWFGQGEIGRQRDWEIERLGDWEIERLGRITKSTSGLAGVRHDKRARSSELASATSCAPITGTSTFPDLCG